MAVKKGKPHPEYSNNVFINCPFDADYNLILRAVQFAIIDCGFIPRCALEANNSDDIRIEKIMNIIHDCKYGIHDICRVEIDKNTNLPRFNMPLELGIFMGCKRFGQHEKSYLVLDSEKYRFRNCISDIAGQDIKIHKCDPQKAVKAVRDWLREKSERVTLPSGTIIWRRYQQFQTELPSICKNVKWDIDDLSFIDYLDCIKAWLKVAS